MTVESAWPSDRGESPRIPMFIDCDLSNIQIDGHVWNGSTDREGFFTGTSTPVVVVRDALRDLGEADRLIRSVLERFPSGRLEIASHNLAEAAALIEKGE